MHFLPRPEEPPTGGVSKGEAEAASSFETATARPPQDEGGMFAGCGAESGLRRQAGTLGTAAREGQMAI
jgi:hypothetical protein